MITIDALKDKLDNNSRLLGLDLGSKRIGVSVCDDRRKIATPYKTIEFKSLLNFLALLSSINILDNLEICFTVLRSIVI